MAKILLIGHDRRRAGELRTLLRREGHSVLWQRGAEGWRQTERDLRSEVVVVAESSSEPVLDRARPPGRGVAAPLLFVQHRTDVFEEEEEQLEDRLVDRLVSPFTAEDFLARVDALLRLRAVIGRTRPAAEDNPPSPSGLRAKLFGWLASRPRRFARPPEPYVEVISRAARWAEARDIFRPGHAERVAWTSGAVGRALGLPDAETRTLHRAAMLHDLGKASLPASLLRQEGPLADEQMRLVRTHPRRGAALVRALDPDEDVAKVILYHHERMDGSGYYRQPPERVPRAARILAVAETFDAMTSSQLGKPAMTTERALGELRSQRGDQFDADTVDALVDACRPRPRFSGGIPLGRPPECR